MTLTENLVQNILFEKASHWECQLNNINFSFNATSKITFFMQRGYMFILLPTEVICFILNTFSPLWWHRAASTPLSEDVLRWMLNRPFFLSQGLTYGAVGAGKVTATGPTREQIYVTPTQTHTRTASDCELTIRLALLCHLQAGRIRRWRRVEVGRRAVIALPGPLGHSLR